jgi:hypothetical protein
MARYRIHRIKDTPKEAFRWTAHTGGLAVVKLKDYEIGEDVEAPTAYAAWHLLRSSDQPLRPGDLLELITGDGSPGTLQIVKYTGFDTAKWFVPEPKPDYHVVSINGSLAVGASENSSVRPELHSA